ncbi:hypothetical protein PXH80_33895, partial [Mycolicibacterium smegmatis]|nr:hypothetical protein [Mycolicibacterium smegmatis]
VGNGIVLIDEAGPEVFKKIKDGARVRLHNGGVYSGDRRIALGSSATITTWRRCTSTSMFGMPMPSISSGLSLRMHSMVLPA